MESDTVWLPAEYLYENCDWLKLLFGDAIEVLTTFALGYDPTADTESGNKKLRRAKSIPRPFTGALTVCDIASEHFPGADILVADKVVKVPEMAESISEGTLKQWSKSWSSLFTEGIIDCRAKS